MSGTPTHLVMVLIVILEAEADPAESSARPAEFANASPFESGKQRRDPGRSSVNAAVLVALLAFLTSMIALALMKAPGF